MHTTHSSAAEGRPREARRSFLARLSTWFLAAGLAAGYGACSALGVRYLFPAQKRARRWQFLALAREIPLGGTFTYRAPTGERVALARRGVAGTVEDFVALSSTCPHLGCQVHWQGVHARFFCPCHNGAFDAEGRATAGPPFEAGQSLPRYPLKLEEGVLFIEVPMDALPGPARA
jgi:cytochrome b6-f complex iron-sulfur subunit